MTGRATLPFDPIEQARRQWEEHGWTAAAPAMAVMTSIVRVQQVFVSRIEQELRPLGLSMARYEVLMLLLFSRKGELPMGKISSRLQVQPGAITNAIDRLETDKYVTRRSHPTDGRTTLARITPKGRARAQKAVAVLNERVYERLDLPDRAIAELFELLRIIRCQAGDFPADAGAGLDGHHNGGPSNTPGGIRRAPARAGARE